MILKKVSLSAKIDIEGNSVQLVCSDSRMLVYNLHSQILEVFMYYAEVDTLYELQDKIVTLLIASDNVVGVGSSQYSSFICFKDIPNDIADIPEFILPYIPECILSDIPEFILPDIPECILTNKIATITLVQPSIISETLGIIVKFRLSNSPKIHDTFFDINNSILDYIMKVTNSQWAFQLEGKKIRVITGENNQVLGFPSDDSNKIFLI